MKRDGFVVICSALLWFCAAPALADGLSEAEDLLRTGQYERAEAALQKLLKGPQRSRAALSLARAQLETGRYEESIRTARTAARGKDQPAALTLVAEAERLRGNLPEAERTLRAVVASRPRHYRALAYLGLVCHEQGKRAEAKTVFDTFYDDYAAGKIKKDSAAELTYVAMACRYTDNFRDASDTYRDAVTADPKHVEAYLQWAEISLEKYEADYAEAHYQSVLKVNPSHADALVGLAQVKLELANDVKAAQQLLTRAESVSPGSVDATTLRAQMLIDAEEHRRAEELLDKALQRNPNHLWAISMLAASHFLRDDLKGFEALRDRALKLNPKSTRLFREVVQLAVRQHRYAEAVGLSQQAIAIDPQDWYSLADLGTNYLRLGEDQKGLTYLRQAWKGDAFNVRNYNLLNLYEDVLAKEYVMFSSPHFRVRAHKEEQALLQRTVVPVLEKAYGVYAKKYHYTPPGPITVELFRDPSHYAVRTVGLPQLAAIGVCFGRVITSSSPLAGRFNWGQVLWHELNHVFTIQLSRSRIPRWFTEGLAEIEPTAERPEWKRENDFDLYRAIRAGRLRGIGSLNGAFTEAKSIEEMVVAYHQGSRVMSFLLQGWGMPLVLSALRSFAQGKRVEETLPALTRLSLAELDQRFRASEAQRLAHYQRSFYVDAEAYGDLAAREQAAKSRPSDATAQAELAIAELQAGKANEADAQAKRALSLDPKNRLALYAAAEGARARRDQSAAASLLERLIAAGGDGYDARLGLGSLALAQKDLRRGAAHLAAAKRFDPEKTRPYVMLARAYESAGQTDAAIAELEGLAQLEQQSFPMMEKLLQLLAARKDYRRIRTYGAMAYYISPASLRLHRLLAEAYAAPAPQPLLDQAVWHLETALLCGPEKPADLEVELAKVHLQRKDHRRAREALERALRADPQHAEARAMRSKLR